MLSSWDRGKGGWWRWMGGARCARLLNNHGSSMIPSGGMLCRGLIWTVVAAGLAFNLYVLAVMLRGPTATLTATTATSTSTTLGTASTTATTTKATVTQQQAMMPESWRAAACCRAWDDVSSACAAVCSAPSSSALAPSSPSSLAAAVRVVCIKGEQRSAVDWVEHTARALAIAHCSSASSSSGAGQQACVVREESYPGLLQVDWIGSESSDGARRPASLFLSSIGVAETPRCASSDLPDMGGGGGDGGSANIVLATDPRDIAWQQLKKQQQQLQQIHAPKDVDRHEQAWLKRVETSVRRTQRLMHVLQSQKGGAVASSSSESEALLLLPADLLHHAPSEVAQLLATFLRLSTGSTPAPSVAAVVRPFHASSPDSSATTWSSSFPAAALTRSHEVISAAGEAVRRVLLPSSSSSSSLSGTAGQLPPLLSPLLPRPRPRVALVSVADAHSQAKYAPLLATVRCYALRQGYTHIVLAGDEYKWDRSGYVYPPAKLPSFFFHKHASVAAMALDRGGEFDWFVVLDGDTHVLNASTPMERYLRRDPTRFDESLGGLGDDDDEAQQQVHIIHYQRMHNGELMAGNYAFRSQSAFALDYLRGWAALNVDVSHGGGNWDQGALHPFMLRMATGALLQRKATEHPSDMAPLPKVVDACMDMWRTHGGSSLVCSLCAIWRVMDTPRSSARDDDEDDTQTGGSNSGLGIGFGGWDRRVVVHRRAHSFARDFFVMHPGGHEGDVGANLGHLLHGDPTPMIHGWKDDLSPFYLDAHRASAQACRADAQGKLIPESALSVPTDAIGGGDPFQLAWKPERVISDWSQAAEFIRSRDAYGSHGSAKFGAGPREGLLNLADISDCWPTCPPLKTRTQRNHEWEHCKAAFPKLFGKA